MIKNIVFWGIALGVIFVFVFVDIPMSADGFAYPEPTDGWEFVYPAPPPTDTPWPTADPRTKTPPPPPADVREPSREVGALSVDATPERVEATKEIVSVPAPVELPSTGGNRW